MVYDLEKYRAKREKVLGVKKRGISFGVLAAIVSFVIVIGLGIVIVPKSIAYFSTRHLDDAIYKLQNAENWPEGILQDIQTLRGVKNVVADTDGTRIVITFDKSITEPKKLAAFFDKKDINTVMLNRVSHSQRQKTLKKEAEFLGPPSVE